LLPLSLQLMGTLRQVFQYGSQNKHIQWK
jgi:hypothetical protein